LEGGTAKGSEGARAEGWRSRVDLRMAVAAAHAALEGQAARIDALNVYPVPDGDTGTNMLLTLRSVLREVSAESGLRGREAARRVSRAALMGARGNSGVILSQITRGACEALGEALAARDSLLDARAVAAALESARARAYSAMATPVEGTMLTVIAEAARAAARAVERGERDALAVLRTAARAAHEAVRRTPELLRALREAGVVDAGGLGLAVILDGLVSALEGEEPDPVRGLEAAGAAAGDEGLVPERLRQVVAHSAEEAWGYCTEFLVTGFAGDADEFGRYIHEIGKSVLVIPDEDLIKVHLHTQDPGAALSYAGSFGRLLDVKVDDMEAQTKVRADRLSVGREEAVEVGVVAASQGTGNRELFEAMGATVVEGGQGRNPSAEELARAVEETGARSVVVLPNNKNVVPVAERLGDLVEARVHVVPTKSIAAGLAVMVGYDPEEEPEEVAGEMCEILEGLRSAEVTVAVRDARVEGREVREGETMGLLDGKLHAVGRSVADVAVELAREMVDGGADVVTLLVGEGLDEEEAGEIAAEIRELDEDVVVELKRGGQPVYPLQMVAE
jgi:DAK2 domain fusion protein YloV